MAASTAGRIRMESRIKNLESRIAFDFYRHRYAHAAADTERGHALAAASRSQRVDERGEDPRAAGADGMSERDCAAARVDLGRVELQLARDGERLRRERFV